MIALIWRELRSLKNYGFIVIGAIALGVAAITSVHSLGDSIREGIRVESRPMMAADIVARSMHPFPEAYTNLEASDMSQTKEMLSMVATQNGDSLLVELKATSEEYPLYGDLILEPIDALSQPLPADQVLVQPSLLRRLDVDVGDQLSLNGQQYKIAGTIVSEPDRLNAGLNSGPRVLISLQGLERSGLEQFGSRITRRLQWKVVDKQQRDQLLQQLNELGKDNSYVRIQGDRDGVNSASRGIDNTERFLSLVALLSMIIGLIGVVQSIQTWLAQRRTTIATFRCLGMSNRELLQLYCSVIFIISSIGSLLGILFSYIGMLWLFSVIEQYLPMTVVPSIHWSTAIEALLLGVGVSLLVALPSLRQNLRIPPIAALRADVQPEPESIVERSGWGVLFLSILLGLSVWQANSLQIGAIFVTGIVLVTGILALISYGAARLFGRMHFRNWVLRQAASSFRRPGFGVSTAMVALGLGLMVVVTISLIQQQLQRQLTDVSLSKAPTNFMIDIQQDQWGDFQQFAAESQARHLQSAPVIMGRLSAINGESINSVIKNSDENDRWAFTREQRLTYDQEIDPETILEGSFGTLEANNELCMEVRYAERLGLSVGDIVTFDVQGIPIEFQLTAIRRIQWESFNINFFLVGEPELLRDVPQFRLAAAQLDVEDEEKLQAKLVETHPNITVVSLREIIKKMSGVFENLVLAIQSMGLFSVAAGLVILIGTLQTTALKREKQIRLLYTLGATATEIRLMFAAEFAIIGILSSLVGVLAAWIVSWAILTYGFRWNVWPSTIDLLYWFVGATIITIFSGMMVTRGKITAVIR